MRRVSAFLRRFRDDRSGASALVFAAQPTGPYGGVVFFQTRDAPLGNGNVIGGASSSKIAGAVYLRNALVRYAGASSTGSGGCTQLIANKVSFAGAAGFGINCTRVGVQPIGGSRTVLVR